MKMDKSLQVAAEGCKIVLTVLGTAAIGYLACYGAIAPWRESDLHQRIKFARQAGEHEGKRQGIDEGIKRGMAAGRREGYGAGQKEGYTSGYDQGYLDATAGSGYDGDTPAVMEKLGLDPIEHARDRIRRMAEAQAQQEEEAQAALESIFGSREKKAKNITLGAPTCPPPQPLTEDDVLATEDSADATPASPPVGIDVTTTVSPPSPAENP